jgi:Leucine-rich repeat (LRR) protein
LNENQLMEWDNKWFSNTPKLTHLFFSKNQISELPARAFANIKTSHKINGTELVDTSIYLAMNEITEIHPEAFHGIDSLYRLRLRKNSITKIDRYLAHMTELHILNLDKNNLSEIDRRAFQNMNTMSELNLARNRLLCLPYEIASLASKVNVTGNKKFKCDCLTNLRDKLHENRLDNKIIMEKRSCPSN